jgi:hypothetical protein
MEFNNSIDFDATGEIQKFVFDKFIREVRAVDGREINSRLA